MVCVVYSGGERIYYSYKYNAMENIQPMKIIGYVVLILIYFRILYIMYGARMI